MEPCPAGSWEAHLSIVSVYRKITVLTTFFVSGGAQVPEFLAETAELHEMGVGGQCRGFQSGVILGSCFIIPHLLLLVTSCHLPHFSALLYPHCPALEQASTLSIPGPQPQV